MSEARVRNVATWSRNLVVMTLARIVFFLSLPSFAHAVSSIVEEVRFAPVVKTEALMIRPHLALDLKALSEERRAQKNSSWRTSPELNIGLDAQVTEWLAVDFSASLNERDRGHELKLDQAFVRVLSPDQRWRGKAGLFVFPVGWWSDLDLEFSASPFYHQRMFQGLPDSDLGGQVELAPFVSNVAYLQGSQFTGQAAREADGRRMNAETPPRVISLRTDGDFWSGFVTRFEHDLGFSDPVRATGVGAKVFWSSESNYLQSSIETEVWDVYQNNLTGGEQIVVGGSIYTSFRYRWIGLGYRWSESRQTFYLNGGAEVESRFFDQLIRSEVLLGDNFRILLEQAEQFNSTQILKRHWVARVWVGF